MIDIDVFQTVTSVSFEVEPITNVININKVTIEGTGGGGATNLSTSRTSTNVTINSDTGTDATIPLGNGTLAGATLNDYTTAEKNKLAGIAVGAEVNVNADWNAVSGDAQILNKPTGLATVTYVDTQDATKENSLGNPLVNGYVLSSTTGGVRSWVAQSGGSGGISNATASGTDTYTATISGVTSYTDGDAYLVRFTNANTTNCSLNINSLGVVALYRNNDGALIGGDIQSGGEMLCVYNSTLNAFQCIGTSPNDIISYVTNADSVTITKGQPVYAFGGVGDRMTVKIAYNTLDSTSAQTIGIVMSASIAAGQKGIIITQGLLYGLSTLPTSTFADGDTIYLGATAGTITNVKPYAPNHLVYLGVVTTASAGAAGRMYVKVQNGYELDELHNVQAQNPTNKDTLYFDNTVTPNQWKTASISTILGYTPYNSTNPSGYQTASQVQAIADAKVVQTITNGVTTTAPSQDAVFDALALKANDASVVHLTGAETIAGVKTFSSNPKIPVNGGNSGIGALVIENGTGQLEVATNFLYPNLVEIQNVKGVTSSIQTQFSGKQDTLVSSINIKSINGNSLLGAGNLTISSTTPSQSAFTVLANNTNASAVPTEQVFKSIAEQTFPSGNITWTGTTNPSGTTAHTYTWNQIGNMVTIRINLSYTVAGSALTSVACVLPSDLPTPALPSSVTTNLDTLNYGSGTLSTTKASLGTPVATYTSLRLKTLGTPNIFEIVIARASGAFQYGYSVIQYFV